MTLEQKAKNLLWNTGLVDRDNIIEAIKLLEKHIPEYKLDLEQFADFAFDVIVSEDMLGHPDFVYAAERYVDMLKYENPDI
ncbi:MAG: hypothetical protein N2Z73_04525 [Endomicrobia bacterium]|nr:hypothetical protein [Endomicrobiia bacterium]